MTPTDPALLTPAEPETPPIEPPAALLPGQAPDSESSGPADGDIPETEEDRVRFIDDNTDGFIYMVSSASITGAQQSFDERKQEYFRRIDAMNLKHPRMIGFGISNKQTLESAQAHAAGAIIGSKFVTLLEQSASPDEALDKLFAALAE